MPGRSQRSPMPASKQPSMLRSRTPGLSPSNDADVGAICAEGDLAGSTGWPPSTLRASCRAACTEPTSTIRTSPQRVAGLAQPPVVHGRHGETDGTRPKCHLNSHGYSLIPPSISHGFVRINDRNYTGLLEIIARTFRRKYSASRRRDGRGAFMVQRLDMLIDLVDPSDQVVGRTRTRGASVMHAWSIDRGCG